METFEKHNIAEAGKEKDFIFEKDFRKDFLGGFDLENEDLKKLKTLKESCIAKYPRQVEAIEALFGLAEYLKNEKTIEKNREYKISEKAVFQDQTEYVFLLSHLTIRYGDQYEYLNRLWLLMHDVSQKMGKNDLVKSLKRGVVAQVGTFKVFDKLGLNPELSHPRQDAYDKIDMWVGGGGPVQVKRRSGEEPVIIETDEIAFPATKVVAGESAGKAKDCYINGKTLYEISKFRAKVKEYEKMTRSDARGYFIMIPYKKINSVTGEPTPDLVEAVREKFSRI